MVSIGSFLDRMKNFLQEPKPQSVPDITTVWHHQIVVLENDAIIDLVDPLIDFSQSAANLKSRTDTFPLVVGDNGQLLAASGGRLIPGGMEEVLYLIYPLRKKASGRIILKLKGRDAQTIEVFRDDRKNPNRPMILFLPKPHKTP